MAAFLKKVLVLIGKIFFLWHFFSCYVSILVAELDERNELFSLLSAKDAKIANEGIEKIIVLGNGGLDLLKDYFYYSPEKALTKLGADNYREREDATRLLEYRGILIKDKILKLMNSADDPEVSFRCKRILTRFEDDWFYKEKCNAFVNACRVVFRRGVSPIEFKPFYEEFFSRKEYSEKYRDIAISALNVLDEHGKDSLQILNLALVNIKNGELFECVAKIAIKHDPELLGFILEIIESGQVSAEKLETELLKKSEAQEFVIKRIKGNRSVNRQLITALYDMKNFRTVYAGMQDIFFNSDNPEIQALGLKLIANDPEAYVEKIVELVRQSHDEKKRGDYGKFFRELQEMPDRSIFVPYADVFLKSKAHSSKEFALSLLFGDDNAFRKAIFEIIPSIDNFYDAHRAVEFYNERFPEARDELKEFLKKKILSSKDSDLRCAAVMAEVLHKVFKYEGRDFDKWWLENMTLVVKKDAKDLRINPIEMLALGFYLNVNPEIMIEFIFLPERNDKIFWPFYVNGITSWFLKSSVRDRYVQKHVENLRISEPESLLKFLFLYDKLLIESTESPESFKKLWDGFLFSISKGRNDYIHQFCSDCFSFILQLGQYISENKELIDYIKGLLDSKNPNIEFLSASLLVFSRDCDNLLYDKLLSFWERAGANDATKLRLLYLMFLTDIPAERLDKISFSFEKSQISENYLSEQLSGLPIGEDAQGYLPLLNKFFDEAINVNKHKHAVEIARFILEINPEDDRILKYLYNFIYNGSPDEAEYAMRALSTNFLNLPEISSERWDFLYDNIEHPDSLNRYLNMNVRNIDNAYRAIERNIERFERAYLPFCFLYEHPEKQEMFINLLFEQCKSKDLNTRRTFCDEICHVSEALANHISEFKEIFLNEKDNKSILSLIWAAGNIGQPAADLTPKIKEILEQAEKRKERKNIIWCLYALARISPEKEYRLQCVKRLMGEFSKSNERDKWSVANALGQIYEFRDIVEPFLIRELQKNDDRTKTFYDGLLYSLLRTKPYSEAVKNAIQTILRENKGVIPERNDLYLGTLFWNFNQNPEDWMNFIDDINNLHFLTLRKGHYRNYIAFLKRYHKKQGIE